MFHRSTAFVVSFALLLLVVVMVVESRSSEPMLYLPIIEKAPPTPTPTATPTPRPTPQPTATPTGPCPCHADLLNCSDFGTQVEAQACFDYCISVGAGDIHNLDGNNNGIACEALPRGERGAIYEDVIWGVAAEGKTRP